MLTAALTAKPLDGITYDAGFAAATAAGVVATRVSNLVVTLDKIKYVMRQPGQNRAPFLRPLSDTEIVRHLLGEEGVLPRAADTFAKKVGGRRREVRRRCPRAWARRRATSCDSS